ncbi:bifunctional glucosamine-1-phosphate N-acetyltransferase/UDP-N-acetylglucosamine pyrophosphorylase [[Clostridium] ultunense Esp]|uniref:bifunctional UDP-N-acetylglucosamine diphosphorylase/glucosamine-1-phosphate N-acetyltransferase GlmU n=1 Tax=Thermicanus aegyptius TaxID=94009 RepID=UPI0002B6F9B9|nr:bifunctional UDP-N-acetylglucosamine diphosphorylase/glucosamine-1-phosphate N-acetyltransferase GlmU [Thermicanus aegyptius]CCQ98197.1 bifunctional glucosamine-1-phosphate N-acetyltransferase/UDP-N-acetylglucosamine pyrophosphorylase [[Clostridium] ultunense Esp]
MNGERYAIVLAAGKGTRMKSSLHKVLHPIGGKPMVEHIFSTLEQVGVNQIYLVVGHDADAVVERVGGRAIPVLQGEQLGTAHAVLQTESFLREKEGITLVINGDTPLVTAETMKGLLSRHQETGAAATLLTTKLDRPTGYGRILYDEMGNVAKIVEEKEATPAEKMIQEVNVGLYTFHTKFLFDAVKKIGNKNQQGEYYLTDIFPILQEMGQKISAYRTENQQETISINDRIALSEAERILRKRINETHMKEGVTLQDPERTYIDADVRIGRDTVILAGTHLRGNTRIGEGCIIGPDVEITDSIIGDEVTISHSVLIESRVEEKTTIGPFAYLRPNSKIGKKVKIGDFVEIKNSSVGDGAKVPHLTYVGDAEIGARVNMSCGSITVNYDGVHKHKTVVEEDAFIGCNVNLVAPVTVGKGAFIAAGSTITDPVPPGALAVARQRQVNKENYVAKLMAKKKGE